MWIQLYFYPIGWPFSVLLFHLIGRLWKIFHWQIYIQTDTETWGAHGVCVCVCLCMNAFCQLVFSQLQNHHPFIWSQQTMSRCMWPPGIPVGKDPPVNAGDTRDSGSIPMLGRSPRAENANPLQDYCLENPMDRGAWRATVHGVTKSRTWLSTHTPKDPRAFKCVN